MASQQDLQELLRLLTMGKVPIKDAMMRVKALQAKSLRTIQQIAEAPLADVEAAIEDAKEARSLHSACKARLKNPNPSIGSKRAGADLLQAAKRVRGTGDRGYDLDAPPAELPPAEFEASLHLPVETDEDVIANTVLVTNRAPLLLAFALQVLRYTMAEQPPSSRLSLAQAVVSANSRTKGVSIGLSKGPGVDEEGWGHGQPKVRIMGREVAVLKRGGYEWKGDEAVTGGESEHSYAQAGIVTGASGIHPSATQVSKSWSASSPISLKGSTFIVRATQITSSSERQASLQSLFSAIPNLKTATHNAWAYRVKKPDMFGSHTIREESFDDGESGCGQFLLKIMREMNAVGSLVVMTRWYGGIMLGPDRWRIISTCLREALADRLRVTGVEAGLGGEAVWGLDLEGIKNKTSTSSSTTTSYGSGVVGMPVHRPEAARSYLLKSLAARAEETDETKTPRKRKSNKDLDREKEENVARLLGAIRLVCESWKDSLPPAELDRRAWRWYVAVRPDVETGPSGWGQKGNLRLASILALRKKHGRDT